MASTSASFRIQLASESDHSYEDSESVCTIQNLETDYVEDTPDTETKSECSANEFEFEIATSSDPGPLAEETTGSDEELITAGTIAAALCDSSVKDFVTDCELTDDSSVCSVPVSSKVSKGRQFNFWTCVNCRRQNNNPVFRYCPQCFQERKQSFPPRPQRKRRHSKTLHSKAVMTSQDSGISSMTERTVKYKSPDSDIKTDAKKINLELTSVSPSDSISRKRKNSGSTDITVEVKKVKVEGIAETIGPLPEVTELCMCCSISVKDGIFIHGKSAHLCFCYKCSIKTFKSAKRCPICNRKVNNVVKVFTS